MTSVALGASAVGAQSRYWHNSQTAAADLVKNREIYLLNYDL